eukprot:6320906-Pyramimonas_sp.AAC.1
MSQVLAHIVVASAGASRNSNGLSGTPGRCLRGCVGSVIDRRPTWPPTKIPTPGESLEKAMRQHQRASSPKMKMKTT